MNTYTMRSSRSCGPDAMSWAYAKLAGCAFQTAQDKVYRAWGWQGRCDLRDDLLDSPGQHEAVARRLGLSFRLATLGDLERGQLPSGTTIMLVHLSANNPAAQHWIVLAAYASNGRTRWHWGDGQIHDLSKDAVREYYSRFAPACIYTLGDDPVEAKPLPWYARAWARVMRGVWS